jgi:quercetin dioxygenase-like cupin family protein
MRLPAPNRRVALVAATVPAAAVAAALGFTALGTDSAAAAPHPSAPAAAAPRPSAAAASVPAPAEPVVTPLAAAVVPGPIDIQRRHRSNVVTVRIDFKPGDTTGWHSHPGRVLVQVVSGAVTLRHAGHGRCLSEVVNAGHGFFETPGAVHVAENRGSTPAVLYATFVLPSNAGPEVAAPIPAPCR